MKPLDRKTTQQDIDLLNKNLIDVVCPAIWRITSFRVRGPLKHAALMIDDVEYSGGEYYLCDLEVEVNGRERFRVEQDEAVTEIVVHKIAERILREISKKFV